MHHHDTMQGPPPAGHVIHWARWYERLTNLFPLMRRSRETLLELAAPVSDERALDVGCGPGTLALELKARVGGGEVFGIDASPEMIDLAREKSAAKGVPVDFRTVGIEALPFPDASFDLVTTSLVLHHLPADLKRRGLAQVRRVLRPGGRFLVMDLEAPSHSPFGHVLSLFGHTSGVGMAAELTPLLKEAGFAQVEELRTKHKALAYLRAR